MPQFHSDSANDAGEGLDEFTAAYIVALYFTDTGDNEQPDSEAEMSPEAIAACRETCAEFQRVHAALIARACECVGYSLERCAVDFWLTRNRHGAGFWDRDELPQDLRDALTEAAHNAGEMCSYEGDDELIHVS